MSKSIVLPIEMEQEVVALYNEMSGRKIKRLPKEVRVAEALSTFDLSDFKAAFEWALDDPWCASNNIFHEKVGWVCSYNVVAEHCDYVRPEHKKNGGGSWVL